MIFWDIDGVIRRLDLTIFGHEVDIWGFIKNNKNLIDIINEDPSICSRAIPSEYLELVNKQDHIIFLTVQLPNWRKYTEQWLFKYINVDYSIIYSNSIDRKLKYLNINDILIDDYPFFSDYSQVILVDRSYNKDINVPIRIHNTTELEEILCE